MRDALDREYIPGIRYVILVDYLRSVKRATTLQAAVVTGVSRVQTWRMLCNLSGSGRVPLYNDGDYWCLLEDES
jgi:hypothetical protein